MNLRDRVLETLQRDGKPVSVRELVRRLGLDKEARLELKPVLRRLIESGEIVKIRGARVGLPARMNLVVGRLTCNPGGFGFVAPERKQPGEKDVYVSAVNIKEALHGDHAGPAIGPDEAKVAAAQYFNYRKLSIFGGSNEIQKNIISKMILGL